MSVNSPDAMPGAREHDLSADRVPSVGTVGLLGGAFDPPHHGHLVVAREAQRQLALARLVVIVTGEPPHKKVETAAPVRFALAEAAFGRLANVEVSAVELERDGPSYTLDTVVWAREIYGETTFIIGADEFASFLSWHEPESILSATRLAVATRPGVSQSQYDRVLAGLREPERVQFFSIPDVPISSSEIRQRVSEGLPIDEMVPQSVAREIRRGNLYCDAGAPHAVPSEKMKPTYEGS